MANYFADAFDVVYHQSEQTIDSLFKCPLSDSINKRVKILNAYYHTRIDGKNLEEISKTLLQYGEDFENEIRYGDKDAAVKKIAGCVEGYNYFSFATKYCSFMKPDAYPVYDNMVCRVLNYFQNRDKFYKDDRWLRLEEIRKNKDYNQFVRIIDAFKQYEDENRKRLEVSYKDLDKYLWLVGANIKTSIS